MEIIDLPVNIKSLIFAKYVANSYSLQIDFVAVMKATQQEMADAKIPLKARDYCAHLLIPLMKCRKDTYYLPWKCQHEKHEWERCEYEE